MVDSMDIYTSLNINIGTVMRNPELLKFVPDHVKIRKCVRMQKLLYLLRYVPYQYKTQQMCDKAIIENGGTLKSVPDCYENQEMCSKAVDNYPYALEFVPECYRTHKMCDKTVNTSPFTIKFVPKCFMTQEMYDKAVRCFLYLILFLINIKLKKCVTVLFLKIFFQ